MRKRKSSLKTRNFSRKHHLQLLVGQKAPSDIVNEKTKEVLVKKHKKITKADHQEDGAGHISMRYPLKKKM